jgi:hypothetical protein
VQFFSASLPLAHFCCSREFTSAEKVVAFAFAAVVGLVWWAFMLRAINCGDKHVQ